MTKTEKLKVSVWNYSSFSPPYEPSNILFDKSHDQTSRWSSDSNVPPQYITLKLERYAIIQTITFGKYEKSHVCNLKKFKILGGLSEEKMIVLLESGLKNDSRPETFTVRHEIDGHCFPCRFLQILPIQSWGPSFNFSIWYVELNGITDWSVVKPCLDWYSTYRERLAVRLCLKHLRQLGCLDAFEALQKKTNVRLEDPRLTELHDALVLRGDFIEAERVLERAMDDGLFGPFISSQEYVPQWTRISEPTDPTFPGPSDVPRPGMRGGHQMCIDVAMETVYLFGGWDGAHDLNDLWSYYIPSGEWTLISANTALEGGPTPRSCHKMCLDSENRQIFVLGRYLDTQNRSPENLKSDFYIYDIDNNQWTLISEDTSLVGGPKLVFDHQMCLDQLKKIIYVFGGRVLTPSGTYTEAALPTSTTFTVEHQFSGLYSYHIPTSTWRKLKDDPGSNASVHEMRSRIGHSMLFHPVYRKLYIFAGQRHKEYLNDFFTFHVDTGEVEVIADGTRQDSNQVPAAGFTQRSTIDPYRDEIHVLSGLSKEKDKRDGDGVKNSFWVYDIKHNRWTCIYKNDRHERDFFVQGLPISGPVAGTSVQPTKAMQEEPCPRYAHQLVYDTTQGIHYLFGGNPGSASDPKMRLDDFWSLRLCRVSQSDVMRRCRFSVRKCRFQEMVADDPLVALRYLQTALAEVVDPSVPEQAKEFHALTTLLFKATKLDGSSYRTNCPSDDASKRHGRSELYSNLVSFFPDYMTQPKANLVDLIPLDKL